MVSETAKFSDCEVVYEVGHLYSLTVKSCTIAFEPAELIIKSDDGLITHSIPWVDVDFHAVARDAEGKQILYASCVEKSDISSNPNFIKATEIACSSDSTIEEQEHGMIKISLTDKTRTNGTEQQASIDHTKLISLVDESFAQMISLNEVPMEEDENSFFFNPKEEDNANFLGNSGEEERFSKYQRTH